MTRDYKNQRPKRAGGHHQPAGRRGGGGGGGVVIGVVIGLVFGIAVAIGLAIYLNKAPNPFATKAAPAKDAPPKPEAAKAPDPEVLPPGSKQSPPPAAAVNVPKFDFYTILPGQEDASKKTAKPAPPPPSEPVVAATAPRGAWLQLGAFTKEGDADNLKAKLAFMGLEGNIQTITLPEKGVLHRVRVGPYLKAEDVERVRVQLKMAGLDADIVKN
jgi:cell division protein FtsN